MPDDTGDEIPVETIDTKPLRDMVELRIRGPRAAVIQSLNPLKRGIEVTLANPNAGRGPLSSSLIATEIVKAIHSDIHKTGIEDVPDGIMEADPNDIASMIDVEIVEVEE